ncbi:unnamed protein product [Timema podura]|uniref:Uncharacterized protein n=1 Tax=Timema podura TaxID=61482 RepID=A0ABN7NN74_TIMPD|nr:unnamed protein product [Timema podura]
MSISTAAYTPASGMANLTTNRKPNCAANTDRCSLKCRHWVDRGNARGFVAGSLEYCSTLRGSPFRSPVSKVEQKHFVAKLYFSQLGKNDQYLTESGEWDQVETRVPYVPPSPTADGF